MTVVRRFGKPDYSRRMGGFVYQALFLSLRLRGLAPFSFSKKQEKKEEI